MLHACLIGGVLDIIAAMAHFNNVDNVRVDHVGVDLAKVDLVCETRVKEKG